MNFTAKLSVVCLAIGLTACATTNDPAKQQKIISQQQNYEKTAFTPVYTDQVGQIEPEVKNPTLDYARPVFKQWLQANATALSPSQKPLQKVSVESNRFALIYEKLVGKEAYQLYNELHISFHNDWDNRKAVTHKCTMRSPAKALADWQANQYQAVNQAVQSNLQQCIDDLDNNKARIIKSLTPKT